MTSNAGVIDPEVAAVVERFSRLPGVASTMDLGAAGAIGVVGDPTVARSLVRSMIVQLACDDGSGGLGTARRRIRPIGSTDGAGRRGSRTAASTAPATRSRTTRWRRESARSRAVPASGNAA